MSRKYEGLIVLNTQGTDAKIDDLVSTVAREMEEEGAKLDEIQQVGRRTFAYNARKLDGGHYAPAFQFSSPRSMANVNKVMLIGNLTRDPEVRYTPKGTAVTDIGMAINRIRTGDNGERIEETTYVDVTLWGRQAELAGQYLGKGRSVYIEGRLQLDTWDDKNTGQKRSKLRVVGENMQFIGGPNQGGGGGGQGAPQSGSSAPRQQQQTPPQQSAPPQQGGAAASNVDFDDDDDIPF